MKKGLRTVVGYFVLGIALQAGIYYYLENDLFAPSADYDIVSIQALHRERREMKAHLPMSRLKAGHIIPMIISIWPMFLRIL